MSLEDAVRAEEERRKQEAERLKQEEERQTQEGGRRRHRDERRREEDERRREEDERRKREWAEEQPGRRAARNFVDEFVVLMTANGNARTVEMRTTENDRLHGWLVKNSWGLIGGLSLITTAGVLYLVRPTGGRLIGPGRRADAEWDEDLDKVDLWRGYSNHLAEFKADLAAAVIDARNAAKRH